MRIPFFDRTYKSVGEQFVDEAGRRPTELVAEVIRTWIAAPKSERHSEGLISFRDIPNAGPLTDRFTANTQKTLTQTYSGRLRELEAACRRLAGQPADIELAADLIMKFQALPEVFIYLVFNDRDEALPAQCSLLFNKYGPDLLILILHGLF